MPAVRAPKLRTPRYRDASEIVTIPASNEITRATTSAPVVDATLRARSGGGGASVLSGGSVIAHPAPAGGRGASARWRRVYQDQARGARLLQAGSGGGSEPRGGARRGSRGPG